ncbi:MAG: hypothetical protein M0P01_05040 [Treponema sp.]|nr:hypothetical protein [Treponema sp.]
MSTAANSIKEKQMKIDNKVKEIANLKRRCFVTDGIISPEDYLNSKKKILWLGREPHDNCSYDYKQDINKKLVEGNLKGSRYFNPMRYILFSSENGYIRSSKIIKLAQRSSSDTNEKITNLLKKVAFINCSKITGKSAIKDWNKWERNCELFKGIVAEQIKIADPDVIICLGTLQYLNENGYLDGYEILKKSYRNYYKKDKKLIIDCYHLSFWGITQAKYINDIISVLKKEYETGY